MALRRGSQIPKDAVVLDEMEAIKYIWDIVDNWENWTDVWALRYGPLVLGAVSSVSGIVINSHYRWRLKLVNYGYMSSTIPIAIMPAVLTLLFHKHFVASDMLLMKSDACPICYEVRSFALQMSLGFVYPMILAPTSALMLANKYATYRVPHLQEGAKVMFGFLKKHTKPFSGSLGYIALIQVAASAFITYCEMRNSININHKMMEMEEELER